VAEPVNILNQSRCDSQRQQPQDQDKNQYTKICHKTVSRQDTHCLETWHHCPEVTSINQWNYFRNG